jgi:membrane protease YdiL (CAAX protease family)
VVWANSIFGAAHALPATSHAVRRNFQFMIAVFPFLMDPAAHPSTHRKIDKPRRAGKTRRTLDNPAPRMFELLPSLAALADDWSQRSELDLIRQHPLLLIVTGSLFVAGVATNILLGLRPGWRRERVTPKPWGRVELVVAVSAYVLGNLLLQILLAVTGGDPETLWMLALLGNLVLSVLLLGALAVYLWWRGIAWRDAFGAPRGGFVAGIVAYLAALPLVLLALAATQAAYHAVGWELTPQPVAALFAQTESVPIVLLIAGFAVVVAPVFEETLFRGFIYPVLKTKWGLWPALVVVSLVFAAIHFHVPSLLPLFLLGIALGLAYESSGTLLAPIVLHAVFNGTNILMLFYLRTAS